MDERVEKTLLEMAKSNQIEAERVNPGRGILFGHSVPFNVNAIIFVSAKHGIQVWYEHEGDCCMCMRYTQCIKLLWDFADELFQELRKLA